ncbi:MAG: hypothetical protein V4726_00875 [Verrucomicrobiota bacterium]
MPSQLSRVASSAKVRNYARGAGQSAMDRMRIAKFLAPVCPVPGIKFQYWAYDSRAPFRVMNTKRVINGPAAQLETGGTLINDELVANAIDAPIDEIEKMGEEELEVTLMDRADEAAEAAALANEVDVLSVALAAAGAGTDINAAQASNVDLKLTIETAILGVYKAVKAGSNLRLRILFGASAGLRMSNHNSIRALYKGGAKTTATPSLQDLSGLIMGSPEVLHSLTVYDNSPEGTAENLAWNLDNQVLIFVGNDTPTRRDQSFMKTFAPRGEIMKSGSYIRPDGRGEVAKMDWFTKPKVTNAAACVLLNFNAA